MTCKLLALMALSGTCWAQFTSLGLLNPVGAHRGGLHLYGVSVYSSYNSSPIPFTTFQQPQGQSLGYEVAYGASLSAGWSHPTPRSSISVTYSLGYSGRVRYSDWNSFNHDLGLTASRKLSAKWDGHVAASGAIRNIEQYLFSPTILGAIVSTPTSFDDLASAIVAGKYTDSQLASLLTGVPLTVSPAQTFLFGHRVLLAAMQAGVTFSESQRLTFNFGTSVSRAQQLNSGQSSLEDPPVLLKHATSGGASVGMSYSLSPRTQVGVEVSTHHVFSNVTSTYGTTISASIGHTIGRRWFVTGHGGTAFVTRVRDAAGPAPPPHYVLGGSVGVKFSRHTFMASHDRSISDLYGLGVSYTMTTSGAWNWRMGAGWSLSCSAGYQSMAGAALARVKGMRATVGTGHALSRMFAVSFGASYMENALDTGDTPFRGSFYSAMVTLSWRPAFN
jgi:hypothetical protein